MLLVALFRIVTLVAGLRIVVATLPSGDVERVAFFETDDGVRAVVEHTIASADVTQRKERFLPRGRYSWHIDEEHRSVLMAPPGRATGVVRQAFVLSAWIDATPDPYAPPHPVEAFRFYAPSRDAAESMKNQLRRALRPN